MEERAGSRLQVSERGMEEGREGGCDVGDLIKENGEWVSTKPVCLNP